MHLDCFRKSDCGFILQMLAEIMLCADSEPAVGSQKVKTKKKEEEDGNPPDSVFCLVLF